MKIHFISVGGSVMHQLAIALHRKGYQVTGTDDELFEPARTNLEKEGLLPSKTGWQPELITPDLDAVILGMHAKADNPELARAQELSLKIYSFPEYIFQESRDKKRVAIGGSHGKTSTTAMIMHVLREAGERFDYLVGARLEGFDQSVDITDAPVIVCEADEYPASALNRRPKFHFLFPHIAVLTGIAWDHINVFPTFENYLDQFRIFIDKIEPGGLLIFNETDDVLKTLVEEKKRPDIRYRPYSLPEHSIAGGITSITIEGQAAALKIFGAHNLMNLQAAWLVCSELGVTASVFTKAVSSFTGAAKRLERLAKSAGTEVFRDFAHAPSKVRATIDAVRRQFPDRRLIAVLELHTFSSLSGHFLKEYAHSLDAADEAVVFYSHHALELKRLPDLSPEQVRSAFEKPGLEVMVDRPSLETWLDSRNYTEANLLLMSSGNYDGLDMEGFAKKIASF